MAQQPVNRTISILYRYGQRFFSQKIKCMDLPLDVGQIPFIMQIYRNPGITQDGIAANAAMDKGTTAKAIKQLEEMGLVTREVDMQDRRINHIYPTEKALSIKDQIYTIIKELHDILYKGLTDKEIEMANVLLSKMKTNISEYLG